MRCKTTSSVKECALRARSGDVHVARVVPLVVDAVVGLTLSLIAHVVVVVFVVAIFKRIFLYLEVYSLQKGGIFVTTIWFRRHLLAEGFASLPHVHIFSTRFWCVHDSGFFNSSCPVQVFLFLRARFNFVDELLVSSSQVFQAFCLQFSEHISDGQPLPAL